MNGKYPIVIGINHWTMFLIFMLVIMSCSGVFAENIAPLGKAVASSELATAPASRINDRSYAYPGGAWISADKAKEPHWVYIAFEEVQSVSGVKVFFIASETQIDATIVEADIRWGATLIPPTFRVQMLKSDASPEKDDSWETVQTVDQNSVSPYACKFKTPLKTRGIRIYIDEATPHSATDDATEEHTVRIEEIEVWKGEMPSVSKAAPILKVAKDWPGAYYHVDKPLFKALLSDEPGPNYVLYWGYDDLEPDYCFRPYSKKFGNRYVVSEATASVNAEPFVSVTLGWDGAYPTTDIILRPDAKVIAPEMFGANPWVMHPAWRERYVKNASEMAEKALKDTSGNRRGLYAGDETYESFGVKIVAKDKRDAVVEAIDKEIKEKFGFGKYSMLAEEKWEWLGEPDVFSRIAYRRWVNTTLTQLYKDTYQAVKKINPKLMLNGPTSASGVPALDVDEMSLYVDTVSSQSWCKSKPYAQQFGTGCDTKAMVDLAECPYWAVVQHGLTPDPEAMREQFSQVYRNGGTGVMVIGLDFWDLELEHPRYTNPEKWRALQEITHTVTKMNKLKLPKPDSAVLFSSDTYLACPVPRMRDDGYFQVYSLYAALGPGVGSWFSFVSDRQIERGVRNLSDYKVLYVPYAKYERGSILDKLERYVRDGGTIVCTDPTAFTWDISGEDLSKKWEKLTGVRRGIARKDLMSAVTVDKTLLGVREPITYTLSTAGYEFSPLSDDVKPFAAFSDGALAATIRVVGKGRVIVFASDPFASQDKNLAMEDMLRRIQTTVGTKIGQEIWRFKLPPYKTVYKKDVEKSFCLTNNNIVMERHVTMPIHNLNTKGTYIYNLAPDGIADFGKAGEAIPFMKGHLTNRKASYGKRERLEGRFPPELEKWIVSWKDTAPFAVTFDLKNRFALNRIRMVYSGEFPGVSINGSNDGKSWKKFASAKGEPFTKDVLDKSLAIKGKFRYVKLNFNTRQQNQILELCEVEIWGN